MIEYDYLIYALAHGRLQTDEFYLLFDNDLDCLRYFPDTDAVILRSLLEGGREDIPAFYDQIGESGRERVAGVNKVIASADVDFSLKTAFSWAWAIQESWQRDEGFDILRDAEISLRNEDNEPGVVLTRAAEQLSRVSALARSDDLVDGTGATHDAKHLLYADMGLERQRYILTGYEQLDEKYAMLTRNNTTILAGMGGSGKTAFADACLQHVLDEGGVVVWFSELPAAEMMARTVLRNTGVASFYKLRRMGRESAPSLVAASTEKQVIDAELERLTAQRVYYYPATGLTRAKLLATCRYVASREGKLDVVVIDHAQLYEITSKASESFALPKAYIEINATLRQAFPDTARLVLQHLNSDIKSTFRPGSEIKTIQPSETDVSYKTPNQVDMAFVLIRDDQHQTAILGLKAQEKLEAMNRLEYRDFRERAWLWPVKARSGVAYEPIRYRYEGGFYRFTEVIKPDDVT